jgi:hypothetical protein
MTKSGILLIIAVVVISSLAPATLATCPFCGGAQPDWIASATSFLEGKPVNDTLPGLNGPQQVRLRDEQTTSEENPNQTSHHAINTTATPTHNLTTKFDIDLTDICAEPNPADFGDPINIIAVFGNVSSNPQAIATPNNLSTFKDLTNMIVYADIKSSAGIEVGRVSLKSASGNEYVGIWTANVDTGAYRATIDASGLKGSKIFNDALQMVVRNSKNATKNIHVIRKLG